MHAKMLQHCEVAMSSANQDEVLYYGALGDHRIEQIISESV